MLLLSLIALVLVGVSAVLFWLAYVIDRGVDNYREKEKDVQEIAIGIDKAAGLPEGTIQSASGLAKLLIDANEARATSAGVYRSLASLLLILAIGQFLLVGAAYRRGRPSNSTMERDARKSGARPSF